MATGPSTLTPFQATYHWRNKNCYPWSEEWFKQNLPGLSTSTTSPSASITEVTSISGDVDLGQRKGKLLTIYDVRIEMKWKGVDESGKELEGTLTVPEVSHECVDGLSEYSYEYTSASGSYLSFLRTTLSPLLGDKLDSFRPALIATHGGPSAGNENGAEATGSSSGTSTPNPTAGAKTYSPAPPGGKESTSASGSSGKDLEGSKSSSASNVNTGAIRVESRLQASADDIWGLLTDEKRIPMWSRSSAKFSLSASSPYELFGGNVHGKVLSSKAGKELVQSWQLRNPNWPGDHFATMTITLDQGTDSTLVVFDLSGVPKGQEETIKDALETYYVRGFKSMGLVLSSTSSIVQSARTRPSVARTAHKQKAASSGTTAKKRTSKSTRSSATQTDWSAVLGWGGVAGLGVVLVGIVWSSFPAPLPPDGL